MLILNERYSTICHNHKQNYGLATNESNLHFVMNGNIYLGTDYFQYSALTEEQFQHCGFNQVTESI